MSYVCAFLSGVAATMISVAINDRRPWFVLGFSLLAIVYAAIALVFA